MRKILERIAAGIITCSGFLTSIVILLIVVPVLGGTGTFLVEDDRGGLLAGCQQGEPCGRSGRKADKGDIR